MTDNAGTSAQTTASSVPSPDPFTGAKLALLHGDHVLTYLRDDFAHLPWPAHWDFPGGGREGDECPQTCVLRELHEEFALTLPSARLIWARQYPNWQGAGLQSWFFGGDLSSTDITAIRFGPEGQHWQMMPIAQYLTHPRAVPHLQSRLADWLHSIA